jgi:hypothetical protein
MFWEAGGPIHGRNRSGSDQMLTIRILRIQEGQRRPLTSFGFSFFFLSGFFAG